MSALSLGVTDRNGFRPRLIATQAGDIELRIPKLRTGSFFPAILEPRRRIDQALYVVVMEAYTRASRLRTKRTRQPRRPIVSSRTWLCATTAREHFPYTPSRAGSAG